MTTEEVQEDRICEPGDEDGPGAPPVGTPFPIPDSPEDDRPHASPDVAAHALVRAPRRLPRIVSGETFIVEASDAPLRWWWEGMIPAAGITFLAGDPCSYKSVLSVVLSVAAREGALVAGRRVSPAKVIYVKLEHVDATYKSVLVLAKNLFRAPDVHHVHFVKELDLADDDSVDALRVLADDVVDADVIIVDSFRRAHQMDENSSADSAFLVERLHRLTGHGRRAVIVLHHLTRSAGNLRGSTDFSAGADAELKVKRSGESLTITGRNHAGPDVEVRVRISFADGALAVEGVPERSAAHEDANAQQHERELDDAIIRVCSGGSPVGAGELRRRVREITPGSTELIDARVRELERIRRIRDMADGTPGHRRQWIAVVPGAGASSTAPPTRSPSSSV